MISNEAELAIVREQIGRLERALASLEREIRPVSERQFKIISEGYVDQIGELRAEVERYLAVSEPQPPAQAGTERAARPSRVPIS